MLVLRGADEFHLDPYAFLAYEYIDLTHKQMLPPHTHPWRAPHLFL